MVVDERHTVLVLSGLTLLLWGLWGFFGKLAIKRGMPPLSIFLVEVAVGLLCGVAVVLLLPAMNAPRPWEAPWNGFGLLSGAVLAAGLVFYYLALGKGQATIVVPLTATYPAITVILSVFLLHERPNGFQWLGVALILGGLYLLVSGPIHE